MNPYLPATPPPPAPKPRFNPTDVVPFTGAGNSAFGPTPSLNATLGSGTKNNPKTAPTALPQAPTAPSAPTSFAPGVNLTATNPATDLRGQTISPGPMADRNKIAQTYETNWNNATAPQFQADLRNATSQAAGAGQLGSGQLRTSLGNLAYNRDVNRNAQESNFLNSALEGSIGDAYKNVAQANQQQAFQSGLQNQTFNQGLQSLAAGNSGNPADAQLALSNLYGGQANSGYAGIPNTLNSGSQAGQTNQQTQSIQDYLNTLGGGGANQLPVGRPIYNTSTNYGG